MYKHLVIWKINDRTLAPTLAAQAQPILSEMRASLPGLLKVELASALGDDDTSGDLVLYSEFTNKQAYLHYDQAPVHQRLKKLLGIHKKQRMGADYVIADTTDPASAATDSTGTGIA